MYAAVAPPSILASRLATPLAESQSLLPPRDAPHRLDAPFFVRPTDGDSSEDGVDKDNEDKDEDEEDEDNPERESTSGFPRICSIPAWPFSAAIIAGVLPSDSTAALRSAPFGMIPQARTKFQTNEKIDT